MAGHTITCGGVVQWPKVTGELLAFASCVEHAFRLLLHRRVARMNPQLANWMLSKTPQHILHPPTMADAYFTLNTGAKIPAVGLGTWQSGEHTHCLRGLAPVLTCLFSYQSQARSRLPSPML